jgi:hypothetical protein
MKGFVVLAVCLAPALAYGQQTYTNADLSGFQVPGAYTNEDLKRLPPLAIQRAPAAALPRFEPVPSRGAAYQALYDSLARAQESFSAEIEYEKDLVGYSESAFAGDTSDFTVRLGYRAQAAPLIRELVKRKALLGRQLDEVADAARRAGAPVERR